MALTSSVPGVKKDILYGGKGPPPDYVKNSKVFFHFKTIKLLPDGSLPEQDKMADHVIDDTHTLGTGPFELLIGREFKLDIWEKLVKEMLIGEVARFSCPYEMVSEYPTVSRALRELAKQKTKKSHHDDDDHTHHHHCGYSVMVHGTGHKDLNGLVQDRPPLAFEVELLRIEQPGDYKQDSWAMSDKEKTDIIPKLREEGNSLYKSGDYNGAAGKYYEALSYLESLGIKEKPQSDEWKKIESDKVPLLLNYSQCQLLLKDYPEVIRHTSKVLEYDCNNVKALYRRGKAYAASWSQEEAEKDFMAVIKLDPTLQKTVEKELNNLRERIKKKEKEEREILRGKLFS